MIRIIETNLNDCSFQSRVIDVESWQYVIDQFIPNYGELTCPRIHRDTFTGYEGVIRPRFSKVENLNCEEYGRLMCDVIIFGNMRTKKLIQLLREVV